MDAMKMLGTSAVGTSERELRWGLAWLKSLVKQKNLPMVSSNLLDATTRRPVFQPYVIEKAGRAKVGIFSLMSDKVDLGPARDSLKVEEPSAAARRTIDELKKKAPPSSCCSLSSARSRARISRRRCRDRRGDLRAQRAAAAEGPDGEEHGHFLRRRAGAVHEPHAHHARCQGQDDHG
jgi:hypothetical protein